MAAVEDGIGSGADDRCFRGEAFFGVVLISVVSQPSRRNSTGNRAGEGGGVDFQNRRLCGQMRERRKVERRLKLQGSGVKRTDYFRRIMSFHRGANTLVATPPIHH